MWTSLRNFLCDKLFNKTTTSRVNHVNSPVSRNDSNDCIYGKRLKLSSPDSHPNVLLTHNLNKTPRRLPMQAKENIKNDDDEEEECCVIAEIPRRKKAGNSLNTHYASVVSSFEDRPKTGRCFTTTFRREPLKKDDCKEVEVVKCVNNNSGRDKSKMVSKNYKFFNTQRTSLNHSKISRFKMSFKNHLRRKLNFLQESYRLTEKFQYIQLLQSHTTYNLLTVSPSARKTKYLCSAIPIIDLTGEKVDSGYENSSLCSSELSRKSSEDQDIQIVGEISGVRSFQDMLKIRPGNGTETFQEIVSQNSKNNDELLSLTELQSNAIVPSRTNLNPNSSPETLEEKLRTFMQITGTREVENDVEEQYLFPELTREHEKKISAALKPEPSDEVLANGFGLEITRKDMQTLMGLNWLNDQVINFYMNLIMDRSKRNKTLPKVYSLNTFFYPKLVSSGYASLRRWTKHVDIFSYDIILIPIHLGMHWCMSTIDFRCKSVQYYDSVGSPNDACLERLLLYLKAESLDKKKKIFSTTGWEKSNVQDIPQQMNGSDCGVFSCVFAEHLARDSAILFTQDDIPYFRKKIVVEILEGKLLS